MNKIAPNQSLNLAWPNRSYSDLSRYAASASLARHFMDEKLSRIF